MSQRDIIKNIKRMVTTDPIKYLEINVTGHIYLQNNYQKIWELITKLSGWQN